MKRFFDRLSFADKLRTAILLTAGAAILTAVAIQSTSELVLARQELLNDTAVLGEIIGRSAEEALLFDDQQQARRALQSLNADRGVVSAALYLADGSLLAQYQRDARAGDHQVAAGSAPVWVVEAMSRGKPVHRLAGGRLDYVAAIHLNREIIGWLHLTSEQDHLHGTVTGYLLTGVGAFTVAAIIALLVAGAFQRRVLAPIQNLTGVIRRVSDEQDFELRAEKMSEDEIGHLVDGFNTMLKHISERDERLAGYRANLEQQVSERTVTLDVANKKLREAICEATDARESAEAASHAKSEFLARMSHEIRTPMNGVVGMTELLLGTGLQPKQQKFAHTIYQSAESLLSIINDILDFSKIEARRLELEHVDFDLRMLAEETVELLAPRAQKKGLELATLLAADFNPVLRGDPLRLRQVLTNLIGNAIKFTDDGEITLRIQELPAPDGKTGLRVEVSDTGIGIPEEYLGTMFDSFTQADGSTTRRFGGTGLGLAICKQLVELMGGEIGVLSPPRRGSTFWFTLILETGTALPDRPLTSQTHLVGRRALLVDDHVTNLDILEDHCQNWGMKTTRTGTVAEALDQLLTSPNARPYDVVLLDMHLPDGDGLDVAEALRRHLGDTAPEILLISSVARDLSTEDRVRLGIGATLSKPVRQAGLRETLDALFGERPEPADSPPAEVDSTPRRPVADLEVLLVEDNPVNIQVALGMLDSLGCKPLTALNGREALAILQRQQFDLVLMDCQMPIMDGYEATRRLRERELANNASPTTVVALTANAIAGDRERCLDAGMDDYLSKPFTRDQLAEILERCLAARQRTRPARPEPVTSPTEA